MTDNTPDPEVESLKKIILEIMLEHPKKRWLKKDVIKEATKRYRLNQMGTK